MVLTITILGVLIMNQLIELINNLEQQMLQVGYKASSIDIYRRQWHKLIQFAQEKNETCYSEQLCTDFIKKYVGPLDKCSSQCISSTAAQIIRVIQVTEEYYLHNTILYRSHEPNATIIDKYFIEISKKFKLHCENRYCSKSTVNHYVKHVEHFMVYLVSQRITECKLINLKLIYAYIRTLEKYSYKTMDIIICSLRCFCRFLLQIGELQDNIASKISMGPMVAAKRKTSIPSVWTAVELKTLINAIDRSSPLGKRDYAMILLACCLGLRCTDIINLKLECVHWQENRLVFVQSKTKASISLPLLPEVGWAIIDYLKYSRPKVNNPYLFIKHLAPFEAFSSAGSLYDVIKRYMKIANMPKLMKKRGMHSLRHTLASLLLDKDTPLIVISSILGHSDPNTTDIYLKVDIQKLKECALSLESEVSL